MKHLCILTGNITSSITLGMTDSSFFPLTIEWFVPFPKSYMSSLPWRTNFWNLWSSYNHKIVFFPKQLKISALFISLITPCNVTKAGISCKESRGINVSSVLDAYGTLEQRASISAPQQYPAQQQAQAFPVNYNYYQQTQPETQMTTRSEIPSYPQVFY